MMTCNIAREVDRVLADVFDIDVRAVPRDMSHSTYEKWDSVGYLMVVLAIEERFDVRFTTEEIEAAMGRQELVSALENRLGRGAYGRERTRVK